MTGPSVQPDRTPASKRDAGIDTAAGILIVLVVFGHAIEPLEGHLAETVLQWVFLFHMPAFVFVSGYVTRYSTRWSPRDLVLRLLLPYVIFSLLHAAWRAVLTDGGFTLSLLTPAWTLWYLMALLVWRIAAPALQKIPVAAAVGLAVAGSLLIGMVGWVGSELSLSRIVAFLPFFVAGLTWRDSWWPELRRTGVRVAAATALAVAFAWSWRTQEDLNRSTLFLSSGYEDLGVWEPLGLAQRALVLAIGGALTVSVLSLTGLAKPWLASVGAATLPVYLLHPLVLYPSRVHGLPDVMPEAAWLGVLAVGALGFAWLVTRGTAIRLSRPLMDARWWERRVRRS
ncbi:acyltransferase family protein [Demequina sp. SO4-13]|uniref:acyltransferase family protein n=1 Tax=Demequina sp. SO4-13 TaxID=3401027 RepID=UPI003AF5B15B